MEMTRTDSPFAAFGDDAFMFGGMMPAKSQNLYDRLHPQPQAERHLFLVHEIRTSAATALDVSAEQLPVDVALNTLITDSLMVARLYHDLVAGQIEISLVDFWQYTMHELATQINEQFRLLEENGSWRSESTDNMVADDFVEDVPEHLRIDDWHPISRVQELQYNSYQRCVAENPSILQVNMVFWIRSQVDTAALFSACQTFMDRHDGVRVMFTTHEERCYQKVRQEMKADFKVIDAQAWADGVLQQALSQEAATPWDLAGDLGIKFRLYTCGPQDHLFHILFNHMVMDGWACWVMLDELRTLYQAEVAGVPANLPPVGWSLIEYNRWEAARLQGAEGERLWRYWQKESLGQQAEMALPTDYPQPCTRSLKADVSSFALNVDLYQQIKQFVAKEKMTYFSFFLAVLQVLLYRDSKQSDIRITTRLSNRIRDEVSQTIANVANIGLLRVQLLDALTLQDVCTLAQKKSLEALVYQGYPLLDFADQLNIEVDVGSIPFSHVQYNFERVHVFPEIAQLLDPTYTKQIDFGGLAIERFSGFALTPWHWTDLSFGLMEGTETILGAIYYNPELFQEATILKMVENIKIISKQIVTDPSQRLGELDGRS